MKLDFFSRQKHHIDHMAPIWNAFPVDRRGTFWVSLDVEEYAKREMGHGGIKIFLPSMFSPPGDNPILVSSYGEISLAARNKGRKIIHMEHGTGHGFGTAAYPNAKKGKRDLVDLFLMPNEYTVWKSKEVRPTRCEIIGTPKMDTFIPARKPTLPRKPVIAIAFHWGDGNADPPESGNAWEHYKEILPELAKRYYVIGHGHPLSVETFRPVFDAVGIEWIQDFRDVMRLASVYINDLSSTLYEFLITGKPVIVLNAPWFRREVHWGIRFWDYSNIGINVWQPENLFNAIDRTLTEYPETCLRERALAVYDLYPYLGESRERAVYVLLDYLDELEANQ